MSALFVPVEPVSPLPEALALPLPELRLEEDPLEGSPWIKTVSLPRFKREASWALRMSPLVAPEEEAAVVPELNKELDEEVDKELDAEPDA